jgi:hypothetical protein
MLTVSGVGILDYGNNDAESDASPKVISDARHSDVIAGAVAKRRLQSTHLLQIFRSTPTTSCTGNPQLL